MKNNFVKYDNNYNNNDGKNENNSGLELLQLLCTEVA